MFKKFGFVFLIFFMVMVFGCSSGQGKSEKISRELQTEAENFVRDHYQLSPVQAIAWAERMLARTEETHYLNYFSRGVKLLARRERPDLRIALFTKSIKKNPNFWGSRFFRTITYLSINKFEETITDSIWLVDYGVPDYARKWKPYVYYLRAKSFYHRNTKGLPVGDCKSAVDFFNKAENGFSSQKKNLNLMPDLYLLRGICKSSVLDDIGGIVDLEENLILFPGSTWGHISLAEAYVTFRKRKSLRKLVSNSRKRKPVYYYLAGYEKYTYGNKRTGCSYIKNAIKKGLNYKKIRVFYAAICQE